jgi:Na+-translocating ferredoxin:NAD+ oxidoreductase subunit G
MAKKRSSTFEMVMSVVVVCAVAAAGLAMTYSVTKDRIAEQDRIAREKALKVAVPGATEFEAVSPAAVSTAQQAAGEVFVYNVYKGTSGGELVGWGVEVGPRGYGGPIRMVVGLDRNGKVVGVSIVTMNETPGLGSQIVEKKSFLQQFTTVNADSAESDLKKIDLITGATKSSRGARHGVEAAVAAYKTLVESGAATQ